MELKGSKTEQNMLKTFAGESQARMRYDYYAGIAKKEGYEKIAALFAETALQEMQHAKQMFKKLESGQPLEITAMYPAGKMGTTLENLEEAANGEYEEWSELYPHFADVAEQEGFKEIALTWRNIAIAEKQHEKQYRDLWNALKEGKMFQCDDVVIWRCRNCGFIHSAKVAPTVCPACKHPQAFFEILLEHK